MVRAEDMVHYPSGLYGIVLANTLLLLCWLLYVDKYIENYYNKGGPELVTNILDQIVLNVWEYFLFHLK